jgi:hypothetical protein
MKQLIKQVLSEYGPSYQPTALASFVRDYINGLGNPYVMATMHRMLETGKFEKFGHVVFDFTPEEKQRLEQIKPQLIKLYDMAKTIWSSVK